MVQKNKGILLLLALLPWLGGVSVRPVRAQQIIPAADGTATLVTPQGDRFKIDGGTLSGDGKNLFHSFQEFGLSNQQIVEFLSNPNIQNILSRVTGGNPSYINGLIEVTGGSSNLFIMNPAGIVFGSGASLNVPADFTATTATGIGFGSGVFSAFGSNDYANLVGNPDSFTFDGAAPAGIVNAGELAVREGANLALLGGVVLNTGKIETPAGTILIEAVPGTSRLKITQEGNLLSLELDLAHNGAGNSGGFTPLQIPELITGAENAGLQVGLTADPSTQKVSLNELVIPTATGTAIASGELNASSRSGEGGKVALLGEKVALVNAQVGARGSNGGGTVLIGGGYQGQGNLPTARVTEMDALSSISVDASLDGNGGTAVLWSEQTTRFQGHISARGGNNSGGGGLVETSSAGKLQATGTVDTSAPQGNPGNWLLDPNNIIIQDLGEDANISPTQSGSTLFLETTDDSAIVATSSIEEALNLGTNVTITTGSQGLNSQEGNITVAGDIEKSAGGSATLTLQAINDITVNQGVTIESTADSLNVILNSDFDGTGGGAIALGLGAAIITNGGDIVLGGGSDPLTTPAAGNDLNSNGISLNSALLESDGGNITLTGTAFAGSGGSSGIALALGSQIDAGGGDIVLRGEANPSSSGESNTGITIDTFSNLTTSGSGNILLEGSGGGGSNGNSGVLLRLAQISTADGDIEIFGAASSSTSGGENSGIVLESGTLVSSSGSGSIFLEGSGGGGSNDNTGIAIDSGSGIETGSGEISLTAQGGSGENGSGLILDFGSSLISGGDLSLNASGGVTQDATALITVAGTTTLNASAGSIALDAEDNDFNGVSIEGAGDVSLRDANAIAFDSASLTGALRVDASEISAENITTQGGEINLTSRDGSIATGDLDSSSSTGGNITLTSANEIKTGRIDASGSSQAGNVTLRAGGDIEVTSIDARSSGGSGGAIAIETPTVFRGTGTLPDDPAVTISSAGAIGGDSITIKYDGDPSVPEDQRIPFTVGDASLNGTLGAIQSSQVTIAPFVQFPFTEIRGNISIISLDAPAPAPSLLEIAKRDPDPTNNQSEPLPPLPDSIAIAETPAITTIDQVQAILADIEKATAEKPAIIYVSFTPQGYETKDINQDFARREAQLTQEYQQGLGIRKTKNVDPVIATPAQAEDLLDILIVTARGEAIPVRTQVTRQEVELSAERLYNYMQTPVSSEEEYLPDAQKLYSFLIAPLEKELEKQEIDNLLFIMPPKLRILPVAALHDGEQFLVQKYSSGFTPSLNLNDYGYRNIKDLSLLAMGASEFEDPNSLGPLPAVRIELPTIKEIWEDRSENYYLNDRFTFEQINQELQQNPYGIVHFATHGSFAQEDVKNIYIQLYDRRLTLEEMKELDFKDPLVELLVLSACETAYGNEEVELGFAGLAVTTGAKTAVASLWQVSDNGTLALMSEFYSQLKEQNTKAQALQQAQINMITGKVRKEGAEIIIPRGNIALPPEAAEYLEDFSHPFYWAPFTIIGNPW